MLHILFALCLAMGLAHSKMLQFSLTDEFQRRVDPHPDDPHRYLHTMHLRTGLGRVTHFEYDAKHHPELIAPHHGKGTQVTECTQHSVIVKVHETLVAAADLWKVGHKFTTHADHFACPNPHDGTASESPTYREVTGVTSSTELDADGMKHYTLTTKPAAFADFFDNLSMKMHSSHMKHRVEKSPADRRLDEDQIPATTAQAQDGARRFSHARRLLTDRSENKGGKKRGRRLGWFKKAAKWVKKKIIQPVEKGVKLLLTGKVEKNWDKEFAMSWNYNTHTGRALKTLPIHGQTACTSCFFHADAGYKVEISVKKYHLETVLAEVYGDVEMELAMLNPGVAVDVKKLQHVMTAQLFSVTFMLGPIPITVSVDLGVDLGLHFTVKEIGATPHITAQGNGHIRFGKQYRRHVGWTPINTHSLDLSFDSAGGTVVADLYLYANIVPTLKLHHIGAARVVITPALDVSLLAAVPKASCDYKPLQETGPLCIVSEGVNQNCALGIAVTPSINIELDMELDIELFKKTIYKKVFAPLKLLQKTFTIKGYPKCLVGSWSKSNGRRSLLSILSKGVSGTVSSSSSSSSSSATTAARVLGDLDFGQGIRNPSLVSPREYLKDYGKNTNCQHDCSGQGFCSEGATGDVCYCQDGFTGEACSTQVVEVDSTTGVTVIQGGLHPKPKMCGHGKVFHKDAIESTYLQICQGRTHEHFCASGNATEMKVMDETVRATLATFQEAGYSCSSAFAELQCRLTFPAVHSKDNQQLLPLSHESCVKLFTPCLGQDVAENEICSSASADYHSRGYAGIAAAGSQWPTAALPTELPSLWAAGNVKVEDMIRSEHIKISHGNANQRKLAAVLQPSTSTHATCSIAPADLKGCPEREGLSVHVNLDVFRDVADMDAFVVKQVQTLSVEGDATLCQESYRLHLCQSTMPVCNHYGNPIKMLWVECVNNYMQCPELGASTGSKAPSFYGLQDDVSSKNNITNLAMYAGDVCSDQNDAFTRQFVGKHAVECGMEPTMLDSVGTPWYENIAILGPLCGVLGLLVGVAIMAVVMHCSRKKSEQNAADALYDAGGPVVKNEPTTIQLPPTTATSVTTFDRQTSSRVHSDNPLTASM